ncbi:MAG: hypothetical protein CMF49_07330 [Legionellales bacterium]|nr:hypothetical protein [Legionellales bacterium]|tara:strand:+ start:198 stop:377 length:180 start_codon:yes stop_codon:yes gene_type:complete
MFKKKTNNYVSDVDQTLAELREHLPVSESQHKEINKHTKIAQHRDRKQSNEQSTIWENF